MWMIKWIVKKLLVSLAPVLIAAGILSATGVDIEGIIADLFGEETTEDETTTEVAE